MNLFPPWLDLKDGEAIRGTNRVRSVDRNLIVGRDTRSGHYLIWGPSITARAWVPIMAAMSDTGYYFLPPVPWDLIVAALVRAREGPYACDLAHQANERRERDLEQAFDRKLDEGLRYFARAVAGELYGWSRWSPEDVEKGWNSRWT